MLIFAGIRLDKWLERSIDVTDGNFKSLLAQAKENNKKKPALDSKSLHLLSIDKPESEWGGKKHLKGNISDSESDDELADIKLTEQKTEGDNTSDAESDDELADTKLTGRKTQNTMMAISKSNKELFNTKSNKPKKRRPNTPESDEFADDVPEINNSIEEENWMNLNSDLRDRKVKNIRVKRSKASILNVGTGSASPVAILKNGGESTKTKTQKVIFSRNTCPFDSIFQIIICIFADCTYFAEKYKKLIDGFFKLIQYCLQPKANQGVVYRIRNKLLLTVFPERVQNYHDYIEINCESTIVQMFEKLSNECAFLKSQIIRHNCSFCGESSEQKTFVDFNLNDFDVTSLTKSILPHKSTNKCPYCGGKRNSERELNAIIAFDVEGGLTKTRICDIQRKIVIESCCYILAGVIEAKPGHFVGHALRSNEQWETYDNLNPSKTLKLNTTMERNCLLLIYRRENFDK